VFKKIVFKLFDHEEKEIAQGLKWLWFHQQTTSLLANDKESVSWCNYTILSIVRKSFDGN
jgi:Ca2+-dependent lipid-binding protein